MSLSEGFLEHQLILFLDQNINSGSILFLVDGQGFQIGNDKGEAPDVTVSIHDVKFLNHVFVSGNLALGEAYLRGDFSIKESDVAGFIGVLLKNNLDQKLTKHAGLRMMLSLAIIKFRNRVRGRFGNIHYHFDIGNDLYESFLDKSLSYTCGYVANPENDLDTVQFDKYERIAAKLQLRNGERFADIGCGFGGLLIHAAKYYGVTGKGLTISLQQHAKAKELIFKEGLSEKIQVEYASYETLSGTYDKIATVGMLEHLRNGEYSTCIGTIAGQLAPEGSALIHFIGSNGPEEESDPFIQQYIFPGAHWPRLSAIVKEIENNHLRVVDIENLIPHYTITLQHWLRKFRQNYPGLDQQKYDERFLRKWEYYLGCAIASSQVSPVALFQILVHRSSTNAIPYARI